MRLESILIGECENFGLENLYNRHDLIGLKNSKLFEESFHVVKKKEKNFSLFLFSNYNPFRKSITKLISNK